MESRIISVLPMIVLLGAATAVRGQEINVALAANGASVRADSELADKFGRTGPAARLIDGKIRQPGNPPEANRWHSQLVPFPAPHPHWAWIRFARPAKISKVTLWYSDVGAPVDFAGQATLDGGRSLQTLFRKENAQLDAAHPSLTVEFPAVVADNFRLLITRSSNAQFPAYTQLSELQVFGQWSGEPPVLPKPVPERRRGQMRDGPLPEPLKVEPAENAVAFTSPWLKIAFDLNRPCVRWFSLDGAGGGKHAKNLLKAAQGIDLIANGWNEKCSSADASFSVSRLGNTVRYAGVKLGTLETVDVAYTVQPKGLHVAIDRHVPAGYLAEESSPLRMLCDASVTPATPMGRLKSLGELSFPVLLHFPDYGTLLVRSSNPDATWKFTGRLDRREVQLDLREGWCVTSDAATFQKAGRYHVELDLQMAAIYPEKALVDASPKLAGVKRGWLNIFGFRPDIASLSNNSLSDNCIFCQYEYADQAYYTPPLFDGFTALDMVRMSLDAYFDGLPSYGRDNALFVDTDPAIVISAWDYVTGKPDVDWLRRRIGDIEQYADHIIAADLNGDGLAESARAGYGISGSGPNGTGEWSSNWWDMISFGWNDAYGTALDYRAFRCAADLERRLGRKQKAEIYRQQADRIKSLYYPTFYNPKTGVLAGWRSKDGQLHDYYFTFINGIAVAYGLVTPQQGNAIMDCMQAKMREVGFRNFRIGLPGNLIPIARKDYWAGAMGAPLKDDGSDAYQTYINGGATASFAYFYIQALYTLGRKAEADAIFDAMLEGYRDGVFQNGVGSGVDWKRWDGTPCGYEGLLVDTYYALTALITGRLGKGVPIP